MLHWDGKLAEVMENNNIRLGTGLRYMDDVRLILDSLQEGWRWYDGGLYFSEGWKREDERSGESQTQRSARILKDIMNHILRFLNLTVEIKDDFEDDKLPTLDLKIWMQKAGKCMIVLFEHYEKPMKTNLVIQSKSALSENIKVSSLSQEVVRILKNCSEDLDNESRLGHLEKLCVKIKTSGYNNAYTRKIMINGIKCYENKLASSLLAKSHKNYEPLHLGKKYNVSGMLEKKLLAKSDWFKQKKHGDGDSEPELKESQKSERKGTRNKGGKQKEGLVSCRMESESDEMKPTVKGPSTVMFVPWTVKGKLAGALKKEEDRLARITGFRIKFTEEGGTPLWIQFSTKLGGGGECMRQDCITCSQEEDTKLDCFARSIVYESSCTICHPGGKNDKLNDIMVTTGVVVYTGETSRSLKKELQSI